MNLIRASLRSLILAPTPVLYLSALLFGQVAVANHVPVTCLVLVVGELG